MKRDRGIARTIPAVRWAVTLAALAFASFTPWEATSVIAAPPLADARQDAVSRARALSKAGKHEDAIRALVEHLAVEPDDREARVFLGTVLSWEGRYDEARENLKRVLAERPNHGDAVRALINVELWSGHPGRAEQIATEALRDSPGSVDLLILRARAQSALRSYEDAIISLNEALAIDPSNDQAIQMRNSLREKTYIWKAGASYSYTWFNGERASWREEWVSLKRNFSFAPIIARYSRANRFTSLDDQLEVESWPRFRPGTYAYVAAAFSPDRTRVYPEQRYGAEIYQSLGRGFEASLGHRRLEFERSDVDINTAYLGKYYGDWLFTGRVYRRADSPSRSRSYHLGFRRFFGDGTEYFGARYARGSFREETRTLNDFRILGSQTLAAELDFKVFRRWEVVLRGSRSWQDQIDGDELREYDLTATLYFRF